MDTDQPDESRVSEEPGLFQRYPRLGILLIGLIAYAMLCAMFSIVMVLIIRG